MYPFLIESSGFTLHSYPFIVGMAWGLSYILSQRYLVPKSMTMRSFYILYIGVFISAFLGSKLLFIVNSYTGEFENIIFNSNFWLGGGFVFYGGLIAGSLFAIIYSLITKSFKLSELYLLMPVMALCHSVGRIACFMAGCCYGSHHQGFLSIHLHGLDRHPVQLYESGTLFVLFLILNKMVKNKLRPSLIIGGYFIGYSVIRFLLEFLRGDKIRGSIFNLSSSQFVSIFVIIVTSIILISIKQKREKNG